VLVFVPLVAALAGPQRASYGELGLARWQRDNGQGY